MVKKKKKPKGICTICTSETHCTFREHSESGVAQCEEFNPDYASRVGAGTMQACAGHAGSAPAVVSSGKGLCGNCENFPGCTYPKSEGGVWHCEEYK